MAEPELEADDRGQAIPLQGRNIRIVGVRHETRIIGFQDLLGIERGADKDAAGEGQVFPQKEVKPRTDMEAEADVPDIAGELPFVNIFGVRARLKSGRNKFVHRLFDVQERNVEPAEDIRSDLPRWSESVAQADQAGLAIRFRRDAGAVSGGDVEYGPGVRGIMNADLDAERISAHPQGHDPAGAGVDFGNGRGKVIRARREITRDVRRPAVEIGASESGIGERQPHIKPASFRPLGKETWREDGQEGDEEDAFPKGRPEMACFVDHGRPRIASDRIAGGIIISFSAAPVR